jgi:hypothetical protein
MKLKKKKKIYKKLVIEKEKLTIRSFRIEKSTVDRLLEIAAELKHIRKTEIIRYALDFCLENKQFLRFLKDLDDR